MIRTLLIQTFIAAILSFCCINTVSAQVQVKGTVYDVTQRIPLEGVSVLSATGRGTSTDSNGHYSIMLPSNDSIYFSYIGKPTKPVAVKDINQPWDFNMSLHVTSGLLPTVIVRPKSYRLDSMQNRADYAKIFNFQKPNPLNSINTGTSGVVGMDPNEIINMFRFKRNRRIQAFQTRLLQQEQDKYIDHRYNKKIVKKLTGLQGEDLDKFMVRYRPDYYFVQACNDLELYQYIWQAGKQYLAISKRGN
ncbi:MAG: carboxypeptidase-like regulatory domain-containing protein [Bacteroidota bacterium]